MKKITFILASMLLLFASCKQNEESKVKSEFKQYVKENFDDPNKLEEIVSVEKDFVMSKDTIIGMFEEYKKINIMIDSLRSRTTRQMSKNMASWSRDVVLNSRSVVLKYLDVSSDMILYNSKNLAALEHDVYAIDSIPFITYKIKYRIKENGEKKIQEMYAIKHGTETKFRKDNSLDCYSDEYKKVLQDINTAMLKSQNQMDVISNTVNTIKAYGGSFN